MEKGKFFVTKLVAGGVSYKIPGKNGFRTWKGDNAKVKVDYEELEECSYDANIRKLFTDGYLRIDDKSIRVELGFEADEGESIDNSISLSRAEVIKLLYNGSTQEFIETFEKLASATKDLVLDVAINTVATTDVQKYDFLQKVFKVDVEALRKSKRTEGQ